MSQELHNTLIQALRSEEFCSVLTSATNCGPFDGGCLVLAKALRFVFPHSKLIRMCSGEPGDPLTQHYGLALTDGRVIDGDGIAANGAEWIARFKKNEGLAWDAFIRVGYDEDTGILEDPRIEKVISKVFFKALR